MEGKKRLPWFAIIGLSLLLSTGTIAAEKIAQASGANPGIVEVAKFLTTLIGWTVFTLWVVKHLHSTR